MGVSGRPNYRVLLPLTTALHYRNIAVPTLGPRIVTRGRPRAPVPRPPLFTLPVTIDPIPPLGCYCFQYLQGAVEPRSLFNRRISRLIVPTRPFITHRSAVFLDFRDAHAVGQGQLKDSSAEVVD